MGWPPTRRNHQSRLPPLLLLVGLAAAAHAQGYGYQRVECRVDDPLSCSQTKFEVCVFVNGQYRCDCPRGVGRLRDGRCRLVNECAQPALNNCHRDATCFDKPDGYSCQCKPGFADVSPDAARQPGRICQPQQNECRSKQTYGVDCDANANCVDTPQGYSCVCEQGYTDVSTTISRMPGRKCVQVVNECATGAHDCSPNAECIDRAEGYECRCRSGFVDASPDVYHYPGRVCNQPKPPEHYGIQLARQPPSGCRSSEECAVNEECVANLQGSAACQCVRGAVKQSDGKCHLFSRCEQQNECDPNAQCSNTYDGYSCKCRAGYRDTSPEPNRLPGRRCSPLTNECAEGTADCSPYATCQDTQDSYLCACKTGYTDVSSRYNLAPGRKCAKGGNECADRASNTCDDNADCVQLPDGYTCKCFSGYVDVSSNANLQPGRVCTLQTQCPAQPTDLVFLIDGSGSIGSYVFQTEVLRFLNEFIELFDVSPQQTRVAVVQYSDQIRHEFGLGDYASRAQIHSAIRQITYLTGLTRTGAAIEHTVAEAFSERRGARPAGSVARVGIVITDGRSQDNVTIPAANARRADVNLFAVGVTSHVMDDELKAITGSAERTFHVNGFEDLNTRLRSLIQKVTCPQVAQSEPTYGPCDPATNRGCDRALNQVCLVKDGKFSCGCPEGFELHPVTKVCGGAPCNPEIASSCPDPEVCERTPFGNYRCICVELDRRDPHTGQCKSPNTISESHDECGSNGHDCGPHAQCVRSPSGDFVCQCDEGFERNPKSDKCQLPGSCDPTLPNACDARKREQCLPDSAGHYSCQCPPNFKRHAVTEICLVDECAAGTHDCAPGAICTNTDESFLCACPAGQLDKSPDPKRKPGRVCSTQHDECAEGRHNCSVNAVCIDLPDGFLCRCKENFVDVSPNPANFGGVECKALVDECAREDLNTCHRNAICTDTRDSYKCSCKEGYIDKDELRNPGRHCEKLNQLCDLGRHDCAPQARCIGRGVDAFDCVCPASFLDRSPDPSKPGRRCLERVCLSPNKHDCHPAAVCHEVDEGPDHYTCKCRDGYVDQNPTRPGRECKELLNECLDGALNDCDPVATCVDKPDGYECVCPIGTKDQSPSREKPGRSCLPLVDECRNPQLHNCSRFADCIDKEEGYECRCKTGYHDVDVKRAPGTNCKFIIDECASDNLNDCDKHATCTDTLEGYTCACVAPYQDVHPEVPGRQCRFDECRDPKTNDCDENADCIDTDDGFTCQCKTGFFDAADDAQHTGRICTAVQIDEPPQAEPVTQDPDLVPCGQTFCKLHLHEVCIGGTKCGCRPKQGRADADSPCVDVVEVPIAVHVVSDAGRPLAFSSDYGRKTSPAYVEVIDNVVRGVGKALEKTEIAPKYITTDVKYITNPRVENSTWDHGVLVNGSLQLAPAPGQDQCDVWRQLREGVRAKNGRLGNLEVDMDSLDLLDPCRPPPNRGTPCGSTFCRDELGEECIAGRVCGCPNEQKRAGPDEPCKVVESWQIPLVVLRDGHRELELTPQLTNPLDNTHQQFAERFEKGIGQSYGQTPLREAFVTAEINDVGSPDTLNKTWDRGVLVNFTSFFEKGRVAEPHSVFTDLLEYIQHRNRMEIGRSNLFISPNQADPFSACFHSDCHPQAICRETGRGTYACQCPADFRDLDVANPGHRCVATKDVNECERPEWNDCSPDARCIDLPHLYRCECVTPYVDAAKPGQLVGSVCRLDYCSDANFCPANTTCRSDEQQAHCVCKPGFVDISDAPDRSALGLAQAQCLRADDVNECALGQHTCSPAADCIDQKIGYDCKCRDGYTDQNLENPGRLCAALLCGQCNGHGDCIHDALNPNNVTCACIDGWSGTFCEVAPSNADLILFILLALLFLLLALLCCLYLCSKLRCFRAAAAESASGHEILGSDYYTIPRAKLRADYNNAGAMADYLDDGLSVTSGGSLEEVERRVTTDVTTREVRTTTVHNEDGTMHTTQQVTVHPHSLAAISSGAASAIGSFGHSGIETEAEQFAITSSDHLAEQRIVDGGLQSRSWAASAGGAVRGGGGAVDTDEEGGDGSWERVTRFERQHDWQPGVEGDPRTGTERRRNQAVTTTTSSETRDYF